MISCHLYSVICFWCSQCILVKCTCRHLFRYGQSEIIVNLLFRCGSCRSSFHTAEERHNHMETAHTAECSICNKVYTSSYLKEHMTFHYESSRVTCIVCSKVFSSISNLRKHEKKHEKRGFPVREKRRLFRCSECPETFHTQKFLEVCSASFSLLRGLLKIFGTMWKFF